MKFSVGIDHFIQRLLHYVPNLTDAKGIELQIGLGAVRVSLGQYHGSFVVYFLVEVGDIIG